MSKFASSSVPRSSSNKTTAQSEASNAWSRTASSNIRSASTAKATTAPPGIGSNPTNMETDATLSLRDRFLHLTLNLIGQNVQVTLTDGNIVEGVLGTFTPFLPSQYTASSGFSSQLNKYAVKSVRLVQASNTPLEFQAGGTLIFPLDKVSQLVAKSVRLAQNPDANNHNHAAATATSSFRTDTDISLGRKEDGRDSQDFVLAGSAWTAPTASSSLGELEVVPDTTRVSTTTDIHSGRKGLFGTALPSYNNTNNRQQSPGVVTDGITTKGSIGHWDQFVANEKLYGVKASFDENLYTTVLNMDSIDKAKREEAERLAREIESQTSSNIHIAEERGHSVGTDFDEEDLYSGVLKKQNPINNGLMENTKKERTKMTLLARTKEQATTTPLDGDMTVNFQNTRGNANSGEDTSHTLVATTKAIPVSTPPMEIIPTTGSTTANHRTTTMDSTAVPDTIVASSNKNTSLTKNAPPSVPTTIQTQPTQKIVMNYAAAVAKADAKSKNSQSSNANATTRKHTPEPSSNAASGSTAEVESTIKATTKLQLDRTISEEKLNNGSEVAFSTKVAVDSADEKDKSASSTSLSSKLNANAKEFTFNPGAKSFTPTFSTNAAPSMPAPIPQLEPDPQQFMGGGPYNPYMQHPGMQMGASMMYPYPPGGMRYYPQGGNAANTPYMMMPSNAYMTQPMSVLPPRTANESPVATIHVTENSLEEGGEKSTEMETRGNGDVHTSNEVQGEQVGEGGLEEGTQQNWEQQPNPNAVPMGGGYASAPGTSANASPYYPGGGMSLHASQPYGHMMPPQIPPMVQGHGGYSIVYGVPSHIHQGPGMGYGQMRGHPMAYSSGPYMPYGVQGMVVPGGTGSVEGGGAGRGGGRGMGGMNNSVAGRAPRRASGRGSNAAGRSGGGGNQVQGALRNALGSNTRYYPPGVMDSDNPQYDTGMNASDSPYPESSNLIAEPVADDSR